MAVTARGKPARTRYRVLERFAGATLLAVTLETGRTHQIRVHMHAIGHPLVGDPTYGRRARGDDPLAQFPRQALHAARLGLLHPASGRDCEWRSPAPEDLRAALERLRG
jgi:23S rRNA pseudouridine1911/1915/1917 synthase